VCGCVCTEASIPPIAVLISSFPCTASIREKEGENGPEAQPHQPRPRLWSHTRCRGYQVDVGTKTTHRVTNHKAWSKGLSALVEGEHETLLVRDVLGSLQKLLSASRAIKNPVFLLNSPGETGSAKGSGAVALRWAVSACREIHMYGFTVDAGYSKWTRYFSEANAGHSPLTGRSYFQVGVSEFQGGGSMGASLSR